ncbi:MAG: prepilin-type N-terminal cleavage/methylation domain-containing protein [Desulfotomaculaceae bacterium]|nr:prepilin-type N-terminal cleavage/methylation domain-containing protein [Desulfotomaculaceae bacterium]
MRGNRGFTLIETMVAAVIFLIVLSSALYVYSRLYTSYIRDKDKIEVQESVRIALKKISSGIRQAGGVASYNDAQIVIAPAPGSNIYGYRHDSAQKEAEVNVGGVYLPLASHIQYLNFAYDPENRVATITIKGEKGHSGIVEMSTKVRLRTD